MSASRFTAQPPRLRAIFLPWDQPVIYFITICVRNRRKCPDNPQIFAAVKTIVPRIRRWEFMAGVLMPDHMHVLVAPLDDRERPAGDFSNAFKRLLRKEIAHA